MAHRVAHPPREEDQNTMTVDVSVEVPAAPTLRLDVLAELDQLQARVRSAENRAAHLERALATNRRIGIAVGILMCRHQFTADQAIAILITHSQHRNVKVRELAESVIYTGTL
jgi:AmiR/NasT family two-component response regulator